MTPLAFEHYPYLHSLLAAMAGVRRSGSRTRPSTGTLACGDHRVAGGEPLAARQHRACARPSASPWRGGPRRVGRGIHPGDDRCRRASLRGRRCDVRAGVPAHRQSGPLGFIGLVGLLVAIYAADLFGPRREVRDRNRRAGSMASRAVRVVGGSAPQTGRLTSRRSPGRKWAPRCPRFYCCRCVNGHRDRRHRASHVRRRPSRAARRRAMRPGVLPLREEVPRACPSCDPGRIRFVEVAVRVPVVDADA